VVYQHLAPVIVLHDITAPRGHMSDGHPNGVGIFWNEIKGNFRHQEFVTTGSLMGFGVLHRDMVVDNVETRTVPPLFIEIPAWGKYYVDIACRFTIPAALASLKESNFDDVTFLVHTDDEEPFRAALSDHKTKFMPLLPMSAPPADGRMPRLPQGYWEAFKQAHKDAIETTPQGSIVTLLNSDIVVSRECFSFVEKQMLSGKKVVVSVGIRTQIEDNEGPPIGVTANELYRWIWSHRHHLTEECIWDRGRSTHPTILFFEEGDNVSMHGWHLTPMFIRKDRTLQFKGTIDDDLLGSFRPEEISYITGGDVAFCEISPNWKLHPFGKALNVKDVLEFWKRRTMRPHYLRNFKQRITVLGNPTKNHPAADQIIAGLSR
jgi:hypothetical protein